MAELKEVGRAILSIVFGYLIYIFWGMNRPDDPNYYKYLVATVLTILIFIILHFLGKEGS